MPWKTTKDPYKIWLSEVILQQTRVDQGIGYYKCILERFPSVDHLALAAEDEVMRHWVGLGYYSRARNLHAAAKQIYFEQGGIFPTTYSGLLELKGVGQYSAAAISSFAFGLPHAVVDGNVCRILARYFGIQELPGSSKGQKIFIALANELLDKRDPGNYNQAIMNYGALVCKPAAPDCLICDLRKGCFAYTHNSIKNFPARKKKKEKLIRWFNYLVLEDETHLIIRKRVAEDIWRGLYEFPLIETEKHYTVSEVKTFFQQQNFLLTDKVMVMQASNLIKQELTHQRIRAQFLRVHLSFHSGHFNNSDLKIKKNELKYLPFPKVIENYLKSLLY